MIENKVIHYKDSMMINSNGYDQAYITVPVSFLSLYKGNKDSLDKIYNEILKRLYTYFWFPTDRRISINMYDIHETLLKNRFEYLATILPDID